MSYMALAAMCICATALQGEAAAAGRAEAGDPAHERLDLAAYARIQREGLEHGRAFELASALADGIGPRLTGSPNMRRANAWTREVLAGFGAADAHLEDWGEFGLGWRQSSVWGRLVLPEPEPIWLQATPWSIGTHGPVTGEIVYVPATDPGAMEALKGKLRGKIVLLGAMRTPPDVEKPLSYRYTDEELAELVSDKPPSRRTGPPPPPSPQVMAEGRRRAEQRERAVRMMADEGVAAVLLPSHDNARGGVSGMILDDNGMYLTPEPFHATHKSPIPSAVVMPEHYNRLARLALADVPVTVEVEIDTQFTGDHEHGFNTVAELPGSDPALKGQIVMAGGHLDSWPGGTGATDNGAGAVVAMEALRILKALDLKPRRTIRIALWSGEEQGELGSKAYVQQHFSAQAHQGARPGETLDAYFNLDEGGGKVRGIYAQGDFAAAAVFSQWIAPLQALGVQVVSNREAAGSDHESFADEGLPGFQFIQDELDYETRTHHSDLDTVDHLKAADLEQAAIVEAIFLWNTAQRDAPLPRETPAPTARGRTTSTASLFPGARTTITAPQR